jgi:hypothetical protein
VTTTEYGDDLDEYPEISASAAATTRDLTKAEQAELRKRERRRLPFGFQPPQEDSNERDNQD